MNWKKSKLELPEGQTAKEANGVNGWRYIVAKKVTEDGKAVFAPGFRDDTELCLIAEIESHDEDGDHE